MKWLTPITGILDDSPLAVRSALSVDGPDLVRISDRARFRHGQLHTPSLADLRQTPIPTRGPLTCKEVVADSAALHADPAHAGAVFQVASQFNLLEMIGPDVAPEDGIARYAHDKTQGPVCAMACGAGTIYRNYFVDTGHDRSGLGQNSWYQLDMLADLGQALGNADEQLWDMRNGYALPRSGGLNQINERLRPDTMAGLLRVGVQADTAVTLQGSSHNVTQIYCSALPIAYCSEPKDQWEPFARLVLGAAYESTLHAAMQYAPDKPVFLTLIGGGAFGNPQSWIIEAIATAFQNFEDSALDVRIVSYGSSNPAVATLLR